MLNFKIVTPEKVVFESTVDAVSLPTKLGEITILPHHIPLVGSLVAGEIKIKQKDQELSLAVSGGFAEITGTTVTVLADTAEMAEEIDLTRAEESEKRARELMTEKRVDAEDFALLSAKIEKELARLKVGRRRKYRDGSRGI